MPIGTVSLPSECLLRLNVACSKGDVWKLLWEEMRGAALILKLEIRK